VWITNWLVWVVCSTSLPWLKWLLLITINYNRQSAIGSRIQPAISAIGNRQLQLECGVFGVRTKERGERGVESRATSDRPCSYSHQGAGRVWFKSTVVACGFQMFFSVHSTVQCQHKLGMGRRISASSRQAAMSAGLAPSPSPHLHNSPAEIVVLNVLKSSVAFRVSKVCQGEALRHLRHRL
jgi:hypothetical protein